MAIPDPYNMPRLSPRPGGTATVRGDAGHHPPPGRGKVITKDDMFDKLGPIFGAHWKKAAAIAMAESKGDEHARNVNDDGSVDRGFFQINSRWHPEVPDSCAYNWKCASLAAFKISKGGTDWSPWATNSIANPDDFGLPNADDAGLFGIGRGEGADTKAGKALGATGRFLGKLSVIFEGHFWLRVLLVLGGALLIGFGIWMIGREYATGTIGKVAKAAVSK